MQSVFGASNNKLNKLIAPSGNPTPAHNTDAIFLVPLSDTSDPGTGVLPAVDVAVWHWTLTPNAQTNPAGYVRAGDLTEIGILHGLTQTDLSHLSTYNVIG